MADILIVDDEPSARMTLALLLRKRGHRVVQAEGVRVAAKVLAECAFDLVVTDLRMPDGDGLEVLRMAKAHCPEVVVILLTAYAGWESAKEAMRLGAYDYFEKGKEPDEFLHRIDKALEEKGLRHENENLRRQVQDRYSLPGLIAQSKEMHTVLDLVLRVAPTDATVLIQGESGTGKEVIAKVIHHTSPRAGKSFVAVNCGALPEPLLESEIFGHAKGAFTGATTHKKGLFEEAHGGTFFLDEIGEMPTTLQVKFLRALQEGEVRPVGSNRSTTADVRVLAATNRDLGQLMQQGQVPRRPLLSTQRHPCHPAPLARATRRHPRFGRTFPAAKRPEAGTAPALIGRRCRQAAALSLAGQRPGVGERHGAHSDSRPERHHCCRRSPPAHRGRYALGGSPLSAAGAHAS